MITKIDKQMIGNARKFQESITTELEAIKNRVRHLIGSAHWGEEGRYKEAVVKNILRKVLPSKFSVGTGFVLHAEGESDFDNVLSKQLDIIVYDNTYPVLFSEGDFIITTLTNVKAIIEVKSKVTHNSLIDAITQFDESVIDFIGSFKLKGIFAGYLFVRF